MCPNFLQTSSKRTNVVEIFMRRGRRVRRHTQFSSRAYLESFHDSSPRFGNCLKLSNDDLSTEIGKEARDRDRVRVRGKNCRKALD